MMEQQLIELVGTVWELRVYGAWFNSCLGVACGAALMLSGVLFAFMADYEVKVIGIVPFVVGFSLVCACLLGVVNPEAEVVRQWFAN